MKQIHNLSGKYIKEILVPLEQLDFSYEKGNQVLSMEYKYMRRKRIIDAINDLCREVEEIIKEYENAART